MDAKDVKNANLPLNVQLPTVGEFFDEASRDYDEAIRKAIPPYAEMFEALLSYGVLDRVGQWQILELGCGTGNFSLLLREWFPNATLTLVDLSPEMLAVASEKLGGEGAQTKLVQGGFMAVDFPAHSFDLVVSSMALHHLLDSEKAQLYTRIQQWLKPGGAFRCADETQGLPTQVQAEHWTRWQAWSKSCGATEQDVAYWVDHAEKYDHYASLADHFSWLQQAGFKEPDCYWRKLMWTVFGAQKA